jgi:hypothetical protein
MRNLRLVSPCFRTPNEETTIRPKPMVEIGGQPILWHILKMYSP